MIPFFIKSIFLSGKDLDIAKAHHTLSGYDLELKLLEINHDNKRDTAFLTAKARLDHKFDKLIGDDDKEKLSSMTDEQKTKFADMRLERELATINNEPWVGFLDYGLEKRNDVNGNSSTGFWFEFDWNKKFIETLRQEGYEGHDEMSIVEQWYAELSRTIAIEAGLAMDILNTDGGLIRKEKIDDNLTGYS